MATETWRDQWEIGDDDVVEHHAVHSTGLLLSFVYTEVSEDDMAWVARVPPYGEAVERHLRLQLGSSVIEKLIAEARQLWLELGYSDNSPFKS